MRKQMLLGMVAAGVLLAASPAWASLMVDGSITGAEYAVVLNDATGENAEDYYNTGLDIEALHFDAAMDGGTNWFWMALDVVNEPVDPDGDPTSILNETWHGITFYDAQGGNVLHQVLARLAMVGGNPTVVDVLLDGASLNAADYDAAVADALEVRIKQSALPNMTLEPFVESQLDGTGNWRDDQMTGQIPEPATLALLALGGVGMLIRRRRA
jgi:hypothetical protein